MQQDEFADPAGDGSPGDGSPADGSPDSRERIRDFLARHGGPTSPPTRDAKFESDVSGWYQVAAADGYILRCDWSRFGGREELRFCEIAPPTG